MEIFLICMVSSCLITLVILRHKERKSKKDK